MKYTQPASTKPFAILYLLSLVAPFGIISLNLAPSQLRNGLSLIPGVLWLISAIVFFTTCLTNLEVYGSLGGTTTKEDHPTYFWFALFGATLIPLCFSALCFLGARMAWAVQV